jgi:tetratricopeptide (TPR) repeat protein/DNA-binding CsgD family transcriptional regulator
MLNMDMARPRTTVTYGRWGLVVGCLLGLTTAQAQVEQLFAYPPRERVIRLLASSPWLNGDSSSVINRLDSVAVAASRHDDEYLFWYVQYRKTRLQLDHHPKLAEGVKLLEAARSRLENCPIPAVKAAYWHMYGLYLLDAGEFTNAFRQMLWAQDQFEKIGYTNVPGIIEYLYGVGSLYFRFGDYRKAIHYLSLAERYHPQHQLRLRTAVLNTLGVAYQELHNYAKADQWFRCALGEAQAMGDTAYLGIVTGNLGNALRLQGHTRQALPYLYQGLALSQIPVPENGATICLYIASALLVLDSTAKAKVYITQSERLVAHKQPQHDYAVNYSEAQALYARKTGDLGQVILWTDSTIARKDRLRAVFDSKLLVATENSLNVQQYLTSLQTLEAQKLNAVRIRNLILAALVLLTVVGLYALHQNRQKRIQEQQLHAERLNHATDQLTQYLSSLHNKNELIAHITDELTQARRLAQPSAPLPAETEQSIQTLLSSVILTDHDWQQFRRLFERVYPRFFETLRSHYPDHSPAEVRLLALSKLGLPTKEMAFMLGVSSEAIRKGRHRLRKKLEHLHSDTDLEGLIAQL